MLPMLLVLAIAQDVEQASREDCEVMLAAASGEGTGWGTTAPPADFYPDVTLSPGKLYRYDCDWAALGVAVPRIGGPDSKRGFVFSRPVYAADRQSATIETTFFVAPSFLQASLCHVKKDGARWRFDGCEVTLIT